MKVRADVLVQQRGLAESRTRAQALILAGSVIAGDHRVDKPGQLLDSAVELRVKEQLPYVSRGGLKLEKALDHFGLLVAGRVCVDLGASTGGFTDVLLQCGALRVHAVDVGYGQLHPRLRADSRVVVHERVNARALRLPEPCSAAVADLSFISLRLVLPALAAALNSSADFTIADDHSSQSDFFFLPMSDSGAMACVIVAMAAVTCPARARASPCTSPAAAFTG